MWIKNIPTKTPLLRRGVLLYLEEQMTIKYTTIFIIGALIAVSWFTFALFVPVGKIQPVALAVALTSAIEEVLKFSAVLVLIPLIRIKPAQIPFLGIGFGLMEGIIHIIEGAPMPTSYHLKPFFAHIVFGLVMALFSWLAQRTEKRLGKSLYYGLALIIPVILHLLYNLILRFFI